MVRPQLDGQVVFETKAKSQKVVNLRRDPAISCSVEAGETYDQLRGVAIEGLGRHHRRHVEDQYWAAAVSILRVSGAVHRGAAAVPRADDAQAGRHRDRPRPGPVLGPSQARHGPHASRRNDRGIS